MQLEVFSEILSKAETVTEKDLVDATPGILKHYDKKLNKHADKLYGSSAKDLSRKAYKEIAKEKILSTLKTYFLKKQHYKAEKDLDIYLSTSLKRLAQNHYWDQSASKRANALICPGCREMGVKSYLVSEAKMWRCNVCTNEHDRISYEIKSGKISQSDFAASASKLNIHKSFSLHSRKGYRCGDEECERFIPDSVKGNYGIACPFTDCSFFGELKDLREMSHPSAVSQRQTVSLNQPLKNNNEDSETCLQDMFESGTISADDQFAIKQSFAFEYKTLMNVINSQYQFVQKAGGGSTKQQKMLMYKAFKEMCEICPDEMVSYLCHLNQSTDVPIQARIFQKFVQLTENALPFSIEKGGETIEIYSLSDSELGIFTGISTFETIVRDDGVIPNETIETYTGSRKYKQHGACFLGRLVDVEANGISVIDSVKSHSFVEINSSLPKGTRVKVTHLRIHAHYEMGAMVFLQRIRRAIVDKVWFLLHKEQRVVGGAVEGEQSAA